MENYQAIIFGVNDKTNKMTSAKLPFSVIAKDKDGKEIKDKDGKPQFISDVNYFANMLVYQFAEMDVKALCEYDYLFNDISVSGRKYGRITHFGYMDIDGKIAVLGNFGTDENDNYRTAKDVFPSAKKVFDKEIAESGHSFAEMTNKERRDLSRRMAKGVVCKVNFTKDVLKRFTTMDTAKDTAKTK